MNRPLIGAGYRPELPGLYDAAPHQLVDVRYFATEGFSFPWELEALADAKLPVTLHGLSGNVASVGGPDDQYLDQIAKLADATDARYYSDHLAMTEAGGHALGHLAPNRFDDQLLECAAANIARIVDRTGRRVRLENLATTTMIAGSTYTPEEFYRELLSASDQWDLLLDLTNVWINSRNRPLDAVEFIDSLPAERISYIHLAGGERREEWIDTHSQAVHEEVFDLLVHLLERVTPDVIMVERDQNWEHAKAEVIEDLARVRDIVAATLTSRATATARSA
jgi:uncharacterized protein (UPF0276 family)